MNGRTGSHSPSSYLSFQSVAIKYSKIIGRNPDLKLQFSGDTAWTNNKTINLPQITAGTILTQRQFQIFCGYLEHETNHCRNTDFGKESFPSHYESDAKLIQKINNILEDVRSENAHIKQFPGARFDLDVLCSEVDERQRAKPEDQKSRPEKVFELFYKRAWAYRGIDTGMKGDLKSFSPPIDRLMDEFPNLQSTRDCLPLARKIAKEIKDQEQKSEKQKKNPNGQKNQKNENDKSKAESKSDNGDNSDGGSSSNEDSSSQSDSPSPDFYPSRDLTSVIDDFLSERQDIIKSLISEINDQNKSLEKSEHETDQKIEGQYFPPYDAEDQIFIYPQQDLDTFNSVRQSISTEITSLSKMLRIYLQTRSKRGWLRGLENGTPDQNRFHTIPFHQTDIFKEKHQRLIIDTAIELLIDLSSSMDQFLTQSAAIMLAESLSTIPKLNLSITGFRASGRVRNIHYGRISPMEISVFKDYKETYYQAKPRLGAIRTGGMTPLGDAYAKALERLIIQPQPRKLLWVVTDGNPSFVTGRNDHSDFPLMKKIKEKSRNLGIETVGLGIGKDQRFLGDFFEKTLIINEISSLPQTLMQMIKGLVQ